MEFCATEHGRCEDRCKQMSIVCVWGRGSSGNQLFVSVGLVFWFRIALLPARPKGGRISKHTYSTSAIFTLENSTTSTKPTLETLIRPNLQWLTILKVSVEISTASLQPELIISLLFKTSSSFGLLGHFYNSASLPDIANIAIVLSFSCQR